MVVRYLNRWLFFEIIFRFTQVITKATMKLDDYGEVSFASSAESILDSSTLTWLDMDFFPEEFCIISLTVASGEEPLDSAP